MRWSVRHDAMDRLVLPVPSAPPTGRRGRRHSAGLALHGVLGRVSGRPDRSGPRPGWQPLPPGNRHPQPGPAALGHQFQRRCDQRRRTCRRWRGPAVALRRALYPAPQSRQAHRAAGGRSGGRAPDPARTGGYQQETAARRYLSAQCPGSAFGPGRDSELSGNPFPRTGHRLHAAGVRRCAALRRGRPDRAGRPRSKNTPVVQLLLSLRPIAGFKGETSEDGDPDTAPRDVDLRLSDDGRLLPLYLRVHIAYLPLVVRFDRPCPAIGACKD
jgi:hypothetical protein